MQQSDSLDVEADEKSVADQFVECEKFVDELETGTTSALESAERLQKSIKELQRLTLSVTKLSIFSSNEFYEELPSGSLSLLMLPAFLGFCHESESRPEPRARIEGLQMAKVYFRDFLKRIREYGIIEFPLPWDNDDDTEEAGDARLPSSLPASAQREKKIERFRHQKEQKELVASLRAQRKRAPDDDAALRDLVLARLRYWAYKALDELEMIERELPMLEMMEQRMQDRGVEEQRLRPSLPPQKPFVITRDAAQKAVFGLGYPSVPVMSVDEWFEQQQRSGRFGSQGPGAQPAATSSERRLSDSEGEDDGRDEERRRRAQQWDEYKDSHRRGWGNQHNKG